MRPLSELNGMTLLVQRIASWALTLAAFGGAAYGITHLPGAGGLVEELTCTLKHPIRGAQAQNVFSVRLFEHPTTNVHLAKTIRTLLHDDDPRIVRGTLVALADHCRYQQMQGLIGTLAREEVDRWWHEAPVADRVAYLPASAQIWWQVSSPYGPTGSYTPHPVTAPDQRWFVAANLTSDPTARELIDRALFGEHANPPLRRALLLLYDAAAVPQPPTAAELRASTIPPGVLDPDLLITMLDDEIPEVRMGAGRLLALTGDPRGIPAFCEWIDQNPRRAHIAEQLLTDLYGPDWRSHCESGSPTRR